MTVDDQKPGDPASSCGRYQELNVFGMATGKVALMIEGDELPASPRGFTWRLVSERSAAELRANAAEYRRMAGTASTPEVRDRLNTIADRFDALADRREREAAGGP